MKLKRFTAAFLAAACTFSLAACGNQKPSQEEVEKAIQEGNVTLADAVSKGWVTQEWADDYLEQRTIPAGDKLEAGAIGSFSTTTLAGEEFTSEQMGAVTLFAFIDPADAEAKAFYQGLVDGYASVKENGAEILVCTKKDEGNELFADAPFPVIQYNDSLKAATKNHQEMIEGLTNTASWCINHSFYSAWFTEIYLEELANSSSDFVELQKEFAVTDDISNGGMAVLG